MAPLALQLPVFVAHAGLRHERLAARGKTLELRERASALGDVRAYWDRLCHVVCRVYWARGDARERLERMALRVRAHQAERLEVVRAMKRKFDPAAAESVLAVLADHMHLRAALLLADITEETKQRLEARGGPSAEQSSQHEFAFLRAAHGLEDNLRAALGRFKGEERNG